MMDATGNTSNSATADDQRAPAHGEATAHPKPAQPKPLAWLDRLPFFQAGLAGYSDRAMRLVARRLGCPYCVSEAMLDTLLVQGGKGRKIAELCEDDHPIAGQIIGAEPTTMAEAARILVKMDHDVIDLNFACPVRKIRKRNRGGHLLSEPDQAIDIAKAVRDAVGDDVPLTAKLRRAYDEGDEYAAAFDRLLESLIDLGFAGVTVHGRTVRQKYLGDSHTEFLRRLSDRYSDAMSAGFFICGSGDVTDAPTAIDMVKRTGLTGMSIARGAIGNPWVFRELSGLWLDGQIVDPPTIEEQREVLLEHFRLSVETHGETRAGRLMRKFGIKFARHHPASDQVARAFVQVKNLPDWQAVVAEHYG